MEEKLIEFNNKLRNMSGTLLDNMPEPKDKKEALLMFALAKTDKTHNAILTLCRDGMGEDAAILCRSIFEMLINVEYILADTTTSRVDRYFDYDWVLRKEMYEASLHTSLAKSAINERQINPPPHFLDEDLKVVIENADRAQSQHKYEPRGWSNKNLWEMATSVGRKDIYNTVYKLQCGLAHSSPRTMNDYFKFKDGSVILDAGPSKNYVNEVLSASFNFYFLLIDCFNDYFKKGKDEELRTLEEEFVQVVK